MNVDALIDRMVETVNRGQREAKWEHEVPIGMRRARIKDYWCDWQIVPSTRVDWLEPLEARLPARFPRSFRSLISRYEYPPFDFGPIYLFGNTAECVEHELREELWKDKFLSETLLRHGFIQFGRPATRSYDPICFEAGEKTGSQEWEIVRLDHEEILCNSRIRITERVARSFFHFVSSQLELVGAT